MDDPIKKKPKADETKGVVPGSRLDAALRLLDRPERRLLLASLVSRNPKRRARAERLLDKRLKEMGVVI